MTRIERRFAENRKFRVNQLQITNETIRQIREIRVRENNEVNNFEHG